ncbi:MAG: asparaginase [Pseudorhodoplanes sp.]|uniref:asparaginase n=1 Tax=Pseudorhodoplanes sp. TaxID=1934341 RepID=UPI003D1226C2
MAPSLAERDSASEPNPILVEVWRGNVVESVHRGAISVMSDRGESIAAMGDIARPVFPRSAVKMIQALPLIESGAADRFRLTDVQVALACASHSGEREHVRTVESWLNMMALTPGALECGAHAPFDRGAADELVRSGVAPSALHNNCSGKHAGFLATAMHAGDDPHGYVEASHPVQRRVSLALGEMMGADVALAPCGTDGCGIPAFAVPLQAIALGMAKLGSGHGSAPVRAAASRRIVTAMMALPWLVSGTGRFDQRAMMLGGGRFATKMGAEGVHAAIIPGRGLGIAIKIDDGAQRAAEVAMAAVLVKLGVLDGGEAEALCRVRLRNSKGREVGRIVAAGEGDGSSTPRRNGFVGVSRASAEAG